MAKSNGGGSKSPSSLLIFFFIGISTLSNKIANSDTQTYL